MPMPDVLRDLITTMLDRNASDLILTAGQPPMIRVIGDLIPADGHAPLSETAARQLAYSLLTPAQQEVFERTHEMDASFGFEDRARFRVNVFRQRGAVGAALRMLPFDIPALESLGVPAIAQDWLLQPHGIVITTGPTGSGKSTSQAAMIRFLNERKPYHVVTIEDPVEYTHRHDRCTIEQREIGQDSLSFPAALRHVFRQSPDVIMIGEMRDRETFETALQLAETGHLVLATLHTGDAMQAITRIVDVFPSDQHQQIRVQLSLTLIGIMVQQLVPRLDGGGRVLACEVLQATPAVRNLIRRNELEQLYSVLQTSTAEGMTTMNGTLLQLFHAGVISKEQALLFTTRHKELEQLMARSLQPAAPAARERTNGPRLAREAA